MTSPQTRVPSGFGTLGVRRTIAGGREWLAANMAGTEVARIALAALDGLEAAAHEAGAQDASPVEFRYEDVARWSGLDVRADGIMAAVAHLVNGGVGVATLGYDVAAADGARSRYDGPAYEAARDRGEVSEDRTYLVMSVPREAFGNAPAPACPAR